MHSTVPSLNDGLANMSPSPRRYVPDAALPPYTYVTGKFPHPTSDPAGHSFGGKVETDDSVDPNAWQCCRVYLMGVDLFNHGYYWESHETWESLWIAAGRTGPLADFLKGLIKMAAAGVKAREGRVEGVRRHALRANKLFRQTANSSQNSPDRYLGLRLDCLIEATDNVLKNFRQYDVSGDDDVKIVFGFLLELDLPE